MPIPDTLGWYEIPNTMMNPVCNDGYGTCHGVIAYSGGCFDTLRNRLLIFGGGHGDYAGNEIYALNLNPLTMTRLNNNTNPSGCSLYSCDGGATPNSRHTYSNVAYMAHIDRMVIFGGAPAGAGFPALTDLWTFDFATMTWHYHSATMTGPTPWNNYCMGLCYDAASQKCFIDNGQYLYSWTFETNTMVQLGNSIYHNYKTMAAIDPVRHKLVSIGDGNLRVFDISGGGGSPSSAYNAEEWIGQTTGDKTLESYGGCGWCYDPLSDRMVGWYRDATIYSLNLDTKAWTTSSPGGTNPGTPNNIDNGIFGRFQFSAALGVFVVYNETFANGYTLRTTSSVPDVEAPTDPSNLQASAISATRIDLTWTASTDNIGVALYQIERCTGASCSNFSQIDTSTVNSYSSTGLSASTLYRYRVRAMDAANNLSGYSGIAEATTSAADTTPPTDPSNVQATVQSYNQINLTWTASTDNVGVDHYVVERCSGSGCVNFSQIAQPSTNSWNDTNLAQNTLYRYRVRAYDAAGNASGYSSIVSGATLTAGILQVGSGKPYATLAAAVAAAADGDIIEVDAGTYQDDTCTISQLNITVRGVGGYAKFKWDTGDNTTATTYIPNGQGIIKFLGSGLLENLEFCGANVADGNGSGIRYNGQSLTVRHCWFHNNQSGILGESNAIGPTLTVEYSIFDSNGYFDGQYYSHNIYIGYMYQLIFRFNKSINPVQGHCFKSRAGVNRVEYNYLSTKGSAGSMECEFPNGHQCLVIGNIIEQGDASENSTMLSYAAEGKTTPGTVVHELYIINNTFYNWRQSGVTFIQMVQAPTYAKIMNNARNTTNTWRSGSATTLVESNNLVLADSDWVDVDTGDFHLVEGATGIDGGASPGTATVLGQDYALTPQYEYTELE